MVQNAAKNSMTFAAFCAASPTRAQNASDAKRRKPKLVGRVTPVRAFPDKGGLIAGSVAPARRAASSFVIHHSLIHSSLCFLEKPCF